MDCEIDYMVTCYLGSAKIIVEGEAKACGRSVQLSTSVPACKKAFFDILPVEVGQVQRIVLKDVRAVVKMPGGIKCVGIDGENNDKKDENGKDVFAA